MIRFNSPTTVGWLRSIRPRSSQIATFLDLFAQVKPNSFGNRCCSPLTPKSRPTDSGNRDASAQLPASFCVFSAGAVPATVVPAKGRASAQAGGRCGAYLPRACRPGDFQGRNIRQDPTKTLQVTLVKVTCKDATTLSDCPTKRLLRILRLILIY